MGLVSAQIPGPDRAPEGQKGKGCEGERLPRGEDLFIARAEAHVVAAQMGKRGAEQAPGGPDGREGGGAPRLWR